MFQFFFVYIWLSQIYTELKHTIWKFSIKWHRRLFCWGKMAKKSDEELTEIADWEEDAESMAQTVQYYLPMLWEAFNLNKLTDEDEELFIRYLRVLRAQNRIWDAEDNNEKPRERDLKILREQIGAIERIEKPPHILHLEKLEKKDELIERIAELENQKREADDPLVKDEIANEQEKLKIEIESLDLDGNGEGNLDNQELLSEGRNEKYRKQDLEKNKTSLIHKNDQTSLDSEQEEDEYWKKILDLKHDTIEERFENDSLSGAPEFIQSINFGSKKKNRKKRLNGKKKKILRKNTRKPKGKVLSDSQDREKLVKKRTPELLANKDEEESEEENGRL